MTDDREDACWCDDDHHACARCGSDAIIHSGPYRICGLCRQLEAGHYTRSEGGRDDVRLCCDCSKQNGLCCMLKRDMRLSLQLPWSSSTISFPKFASLDVPREGAHVDG